MSFSGDSYDSFNIPADIFSSTRVDFGEDMVEFNPPEIAECQQKLQKVQERAEIEKKIRVGMDERIVLMTKWVDEKSNEILELNQMLKKQTSQEPPLRRANEMIQTAMADEEKFESSGHVSNIIAKRDENKIIFGELAREMHQSFDLGEPIKKLLDALNGLIVSKMFGSLKNTLFIDDFTES